MGKKFRTSGWSRAVMVDMDNVRLHGNYAAVRGVKKPVVADKPNVTEPDNHENFVQNLKDFVGKSFGCWMVFNNDYEKIVKDCDFTENDYYQVVKYAIGLYPNQMAKVRSDRLTDVHYYDICNVMARAGEFQGVDFEKLAKVKIHNVTNPVFNIANIAVESFGTTPLIYDVFEMTPVTHMVTEQVVKRVFFSLIPIGKSDVVRSIVAHKQVPVPSVAKNIENLARDETYLTKRDAALLLMHLWLRQVRVNVSATEITNWIENDVLSKDDVTRLHNSVLAKIDDYKDFDFVVPEVPELENVPEFCGAVCNNINKIMRDKRAQIYSAKLKTLENAR